MSQTKIVLSVKELDMVTDRGWILTKEKIIQQVYALLESVVADIDATILPGWELLSKRAALVPRIFKGENYLGLPYVTLDHPRLYDGDNTLTVRTMFWWGNFVSVTLHASGMYKEPVLQKINALQLSGKKDLYICIHESQWHHNFEPDNYVPLALMTGQKIQEIAAEKTFVKIAYRISLQQFNELSDLLPYHYKLLATILA